VRTEVDAYQYPVHASYAFPLAAGAGPAAVVKGAPGRLCTVICTAPGGGSVGIIFYDNASAASGTIIGEIPATATLGQQFQIDMPAANGITANASAGSPAVTVGYS
jgi:hypothetical protein